MLGIEITQQALFSGVVYGLVYAVFAAGFVLVYRSTGVLNFAQGEIGAFGVALFVLIHMQYGVPYWFAFLFAVIGTAIIGMVIELVVVRRLFDSPRLVLLIATVPISIAGWGVRESSMIATFAYAGLAESDGLTLSILFGAVSLIIGIVGGIVWISSGFRTATFTPTVANAEIATGRP